MDDLAMLNLICFILNLVIVLVIGVTLAILPNITRKSLLFGIRVPESAQDLPEVRSMKSRFSLSVAILSLAALAAAVLQYLYRPELSLLTSLYLPLVMLAFQFAIYLPLWRRAAALKQASGWVLPATSSAETRSARSRERFGGLPWVWYIGAAGLSVLAALASMAFYPSVPDVIVTHWNAAMQADAWAAKSYAHVLAMPVLSLVMALFMLGCNLIVYRMKLQVSQENPALSFAQHRVYRRLMSHVLGFIALCISLLFLALQPMMLNLWIPSGSFMIGYTIVPMILMMIPPILLTLKAGQAGNKLRPTVTEADVSAAGLGPEAVQTTRKVYNDDRFWKLGMFYYNNEDPSLFVEDRFGNNGGMNYARPAALVIAALLFVIIAVTYVGSTILFVSMMG